MYTRWAERKGYTVETLDWQDGDEAGLRTATSRSPATTPTDS
jgi:peptide chain release factor 2